MKYKFFVKNESSKSTQKNEILVLHMSYKTEKDSVLFDTKELNGQPFRMKYYGPSKNGGTIDDAFSLMHEGDSAQFIVDAEKFYIETKKTEVPSFIKKGSKLIFNIKLIEIFSYKKYIEDLKKNNSQSPNEENILLNSYLTNANINVKPTESGLYYIENQKGNGKKVKNKSKVIINYTASFVNGEVFDSSLERNEPFEFECGKNEVIEGLEEGIMLMTEKGKATLIIPSKLAYGNQQYKVVPPYSTLIFEVELIKIK